MPIANTSLFETTIAALATPTGAGALGIVRLSGPKAWTIAQALFTPTSSPQKQGAEPKPWTPRLAQLGVLQSSDGLWIDQVLLLPFKGPHSATGEDVVEFHCHGSPAVLSAVLKACLHEGALAAQPGEFTQRAFVHGRLDLTQAESVLDLIHTHSPRLMDAATHNLHQRTLQQTIQGLCEPLIALQSQLTACVDFPDEVDEPPRYDLLSQAQLLEHQVQALLSSSRHNAPIRQGLTVVLVGAPNAGKSSLFNALLTQDRAIVTPLAGTTRDTLHETLWINGIAVTLVDTAGLRNDHADMVEALGIERTREAIEHADAVWFLVDASQGITPHNQTLWDELDSLSSSAARLNLWTQTDKPSAHPAPAGWLGTSIIQHTGLEPLNQWLIQWVNQALTQQQAYLQTTHQWVLNQRQQNCLSACHKSLEELNQTLANHNMPLDMATIPLTDALLSLDKLLGRNTTELVLDEIFSQFCVGK